jgi:hypothetical protein
MSPPNRSLAGVSLEFGFLGSFHLRYLNEANALYRPKIVHLNRAEQSSARCWSTPLRSLSFNDLATL